MFPTVDDAVYIYARACRAWYGRKASDLAREKVAQFKTQGDQHGAFVWEKVENELEGLDRNPDRRLS